MHAWLIETAIFLLHTWRCWALLSELLLAATHSKVLLCLGKPYNDKELSSKRWTYFLYDLLSPWIALASIVSPALLAALIAATAATGSSPGSSIAQANYTSNVLPPGPTNTAAQLYTISSRSQLNSTAGAAGSSCCSSYPPSRPPLIPPYPLPGLAQAADNFQLMEDHEEVHEVSAAQAAAGAFVNCNMLPEQQCSSAAEALQPYKQASACKAANSAPLYQPAALNSLQQQQQQQRLLPLLLLLLAGHAALHIYYIASWHEPHSRNVIEMSASSNMGNRWQRFRVQEVAWFMTGTSYDIAIHVVVSGLLVHSIWCGSSSNLLAAFAK